MRNSRYFSRLFFYYNKDIERRCYWMNEKHRRNMYKVCVADNLLSIFLKFLEIDRKIDEITGENLI